MFATSHGGAVHAPRLSSLFPHSAAPRRIAEHLDAVDYDHPTLVLDTGIVAERYRALSTGLGHGADIHYAVKANPAPAVLRRLREAGSRFDAASRGEIELCLGLGAAPSEISFGNTIKRVRDIAWAHGVGIDLFAADAAEEIEKIAANAPGARVYLRVLIEESPGDWPLGRKFGAPASEILELMRRAAGLGLRPVGLSFHIGSQTRRAGMWAPVLEGIAALWHGMRAEGHALTLLNIGGGFPADYGDPVDATLPYAAQLSTEIRRRFGPVRIMAEPGRGLVAEAGVIAAEVLLVSRKRPSDIARWVYLDIGKFSGLAETMDEAIRYRIETSADGGETGPCVLAGPSCDSADVLYERRPMQLPAALRAGDKVRILAAGAYTTTYASVGFNGFPPLDEVCL